MSNPGFFLDDILGRCFTPRKSRRKAEPDYGTFRRLCKKNNLTYTVAADGFVDIQTPDGVRFAIGQGWDQRVTRLEAIIQTGFDPGGGPVAWPAKVGPLDD